MITICWVFIITDTAFLSFNRVTLSSSEAEHVCLLESRFKRKNAIKFPLISVICFALGQTGQKAREKIKFLCGGDYQTIIEKLHFKNRTETEGMRLLLVYLQGHFCSSFFRLE